MPPHDGDIDASGHNVRLLFSQYRQWEETLSTEKALSEWCSKVADRWPFHYEIALTEDLINRESLVATSPVLHHLGHGIFYYDHGIGKKIIRQPASEQAALALWRINNSEPLRKDHLEVISSLLGGSPHIREAAACTHRYLSGHRFIYLDQQFISNRIKKYLEDYNSTNVGTTLATCYQLYLDFLCIHPFHDGNGRIARVLFQGMLHRAFGLSVPALPLSAPISLNRANYLQSLVSIHVDKDISSFVKAMNSYAINGTLMLPRSRYKNP